MPAVKLIVAGLLFIDGNSALTWALAWSHKIEKHLHDVSLIVSELHFCCVWPLIFKCKGDNQRYMQQFLNSRGQGGRTGPCLLLTSRTLKMGK